MSTNISWTDKTWNPVTGCSKVSSGCKNCFAAALAPRLAAMGHKGYTDLPWTKKNAEQNVHLHYDRLEKPLHWKKPRRVFVNSMSDLFHELVPDEFIARVFGVMAEAGQHTFQILTKRPERMAELLNTRRFVNWVEHSGPEGQWICGGSLPWPLPNCWLGTSVENQKAADERIPHLLRVPAAVRFLSCEPLLGPVDLRNVRAGNDALIDCLEGDVKTPEGDIYAACPGNVTWIIAGGESGHGFRPMNPEWARSLRDQASAAGVAFWFKQDSGLRPETNALLDGEEWHQFPETFQTLGQRGEKA